MHDDADRQRDIALLQAVEVAQAAEEQLDIAALAAQFDVSPPTVEMWIEQLDAAGLVLSGSEEHGPPFLLDAGRQFLDARGQPAGCVAEEILAVRLIEGAEYRLEMRRDEGEITEEQEQAAAAELRGVFELFQDDDVLDMFEMEEPADAALAGHEPINQQMGVADQRIENWLRPFGGTIPTGYISSGE